MATLRKDGRYMARKRTPAGTVFGYGKTPEEAENNLAEKLEADTLSTELRRPETIHEFAKAVWYPRIQNLEPHSLAKYERTYIHHIRLALGHLPFAELDTRTVQTWVNSLVSHRARPKGTPQIPLTPVGKRFALSTLRGMVLLAEGSGLSCPASFRMVRLPRAKAKRRRVVDVDTAINVLAAVDGTPLSCPVWLALVLGMRRGEVAGLRWEDLDRVRGELRIERQRQGVTGRSVVEKSLKSGTGRTLRLTPELIEEIDRRGDLDSHYVCSYAGKPFVPDTIAELWAQKRDSVGLGDWTFHDLRHGAAGLLYALTRDLMVVAAILGHADPQMSVNYTALQDAAAGDALKELGAKIGLRPST